MARMRSPSYPSISLAQAIEYTDKIHSLNRTNVIDRESAARDMGYSGLTGRSLQILAALIQFGLISKAGKGDVKVTQTAVDILHSVEEQDKIAAIQNAGRSPTLFQELHDRFPDGPPSENAIRSYLIQQGFADVAIGPAVSSFMDTYHYLRSAGEGKGHGADSENGELSPEEQNEPEIPMQPQTLPATLDAPSPVAIFANSLAESCLNEINMNIQGDKVHVSAVLDYKGLLRLEKKITGLKALMQPDVDSEVDEEAEH